MLIVVDEKLFLFMSFPNAMVHNSFEICYICTCISQFKKETFKTIKVGMRVKNFHKIVLNAKTFISKTGSKLMSPN